jgi:hypothetical protein
MLFVRELRPPRTAKDFDLDKPPKEGDEGVEGLPFSSID